MATFVDLSHPLEQGQATFPDDPKLSILPFHTIGAIGYNLTLVSMSSHQGTHLDVPFHFFDDGKTLDQVPLERFFGPATLVDLAPGGALEPKTPITVEMFLPHESKFQPGAKVLYRTGWDHAFGTPEFFTDFPTLTLAAARWIAAKRIGLLGMDTGTPSVDWKECHWTLLGKDAEIILVEGLANLDKLPERFTFVGFPMNLKGRDGSPVRAVAIIDT